MLTFVDCRGVGRSWPRQVLEPETLQDVEGLNKTAMASSLRLLPRHTPALHRPLSSLAARQCYLARKVPTSTLPPSYRRHYASESDQVFNKGVATKTMDTPEPHPNARPTLPEFDLSDNVILVTGGARGLGLCMAEAFLQSGAIVYGLDRLPEDQRSEEFLKIAERAKNEWGSELVSVSPLLVLIQKNHCANWRPSYRSD